MQKDGNLPVAPGNGEDNPAFAETGKSAQKLLELHN
jgi:hypothetical protein